MKRFGFKKPLLFALIGALFSGTLIGISSFGWFVNYRYNDTSVSSEININYFNGGNGSAPVAGQTYNGGEKEGPFQIHNSTQLYHLAWLQDMGYFNTINDAGNLNQTYFILTADIDMDGKTLPSIGTEDYPFVGNFNGNEKTISNLKVTNSTTKSDYTDNPTSKNPNLHDDVGEIVGFFGVVGTLEGDISSPSATLGGYTYDTTINEIHDFIIRNCVIETKTTNALVGIAVGYLNGYMNNVGVVNSDISLGSTGSLKAKYGRFSDNFSDYSLVGYSSQKGQYIDENTLKGYSKTSDVTRISTDAPGTAWGASIDMRKIYNRVTDINNNHIDTDKSHFSYHTSETFTKQNDGTFALTDSTSDTMANWDDGSTYRGSWRFYQSPDAGQYFYSNSDTQWNYLYGGNLKNNHTLTVKKIDPTKQDINGFYILGSTSEEANYGLAITGTNTLSTIAVQDKYAYPANLTVFAQDSSGHIYGVNKNNNTTYFLNVSNGALSLSTNGTTTWSVSEVVTSGDYKTYSITSGSNYIAFENNAFVLKTSYAYISNNEGTYLQLNGTSSFTTTTNINNATHFFMESVSGGYIIYGVYSGSNVYLYDNGNALAVRNRTSSAQTFDFNGEEFYVNDNQSKYLIYKNNTFAFGPREEPGSIVIGENVYVHIGTNYLTNSGTSSITTTTLDNSPAEWKLTTSGSGYKFSTVINGKTYYLYTSNNKTLSLNSSGSEFLYQNGYFYIQGTWSTVYAINSNFSLTYCQNTGSLPSGGAILEGVTKSIENKLGAYKVVSSNVCGYPGNTQEIESEEQPSGFTTCFPLTTEESFPYNVDINNTGYITSGGFSGSSSSGVGDIRISRYTKSDLGNSLRNGRINTVYTVDDSGKHVLDSTKFNKYNSSKEQFQETLDSESSRIFGLHFMDSTINSHHLTRLPKATILGQTFNNYQFPMDSVDVNIAQRGFVNFFAGTYYHSNTSFFTIHQIFRENNEITAIKEIDRVYGKRDANGNIDPTSNFVYLYGDNTYSGTRPSDYVEIFNSNWIKRQDNITMDALYYFEVPVNPGEYALGSVPGEDGAYLCYLDLSCSQQWADSVTTTTKDSICKDTYEYATGAEFLCDREINNAATFNDIFNQNNGAQFQVTNSKEQGTISYTKDYVGETSNKLKATRATKFDPIPSEYNRLEYITSNCSELIDTGYLDGPNVTVNCKFESLQTYGEGHYLFGSQQNSSNMMYNGFYRSSNSHKFDFEYNYQSAILNIDASSDKIMEMTQTISGNKMNTVINGQSYSFDKGTSLSATSNMYIFGCKKNNGSERFFYSPLRCYYFEMYDNGTKVRDFVPAQNSKGVSGLYDLVEGKFYTPDIGHFTPIGLPSGYTLLDSIASTSSGFNTTFTATKNTTVVAEFQVTTARSGKYFFGANTSSNRAYNSIRTSSTSQLTLNLDRKDTKTGIGYNTSSKVILKETLSGSNINYNIYSGSSYFSGSQAITSTTSTSNTMRIFGAYGNSYGTGLKCYSFKMYDNGTLQRDFVPCENDSGQTGFYDLANSKFYSYGTAGSTVDNTAVHAHTYSSEWSTNATHHWYNTTCGHDDKGDLAAHTFNDWHQTKAPTFEDTGLEERNCTVCGYTEQRIIPRLEHHYSSTWSKDATYHWHACTDSGYENLKADSATHTYGAWSTITPATFESDGLQERTCSVCGYVEQGVIPATSHHFASNWSTNETSHWHACTDAGYSNLKADEANHTFEGDICSVCGFERDHVHIFEPTWSTDDFHHWHASTCGHDVMDQYEGHSFNRNGDCTVCGYHTNRPLQFGDYEILATPGDDINAVMVGNNARINEGMLTIPFKREYQDEYTIIRTDTSNTGTIMTGYVTITDSNSQYSDGSTELIRDIEAEITYTLTNGTVVTLCKFEITGLQSFVDFNYSYVYNATTNDFYFTVQTSANVSVNITQVAGSGYTIHFMGTTDYVTISSPQAISINASGSFTPIIVPNE